MENQYKGQCEWSEMSADCNKTLSAKPVVSTNKDVKGPVVEVTPNGKHFRFSLFFDGTRNNRYNTDYRKANEAAYPNNDDYESYWNDYSNIAKMEKYLNTDASNTPYHSHQKIYIEGIGTYSLEDNPTHKKTDSTLGAGFAVAGTGIKAKVESAIKTIATRIDALYLYDEDPKKTRIVESITFDVFGFSRGAAAARYFIYRVKEQDAIRNELTNLYPKEYPDYIPNANPIKKNPMIVNTDINFVGLFDTVASHWVAYENDPADLYLDAVKHASIVIHLTAANEYRANFNLTTIESAIKSAKTGGKTKKALEISLPGAHSDIGGGYRNNVNEKEWLISENDWSSYTMTEVVEKLKTDQKWLMKQGWYTASEFEPIKTGFLDATEIVANRMNIKNHYSLIPLLIMIHYAKRDAKLNFLESDIKEIHRELKDEFPGKFPGSDFKDEMWNDVLPPPPEDTNNPKTPIKPMPENQTEWFEKSALNKLYEKLYTEDDVDWNPGDWQKDFEKSTDSILKNIIPIVRHRYCHMSSRRDGEVWPHKPNWRDHMRHRIIMPG